MTIAVDQTSASQPSAVPRIAVSPRAALVAVAGFASLGAGAIHAAAIGVHAEHRPAALAFTVVAALQLLWGIAAVVRANRTVIATGLVISLACVAGWVLAKSSGISFIDGLDVKEPIQAADALAAGLALATAVFLGISLVASPAPYASTMPRLGVPVAAVAVTLLSLYGMVAAGTHVHAHDAGGATLSADGHDHGNAPAAAAAGPGTTIAGDHTMDHSGDGADHGATATPVVKPYDPTQPIDLSGTPGVTPQQQAAAENLIAVTLVRLPKWSDPNVALAAGFHSIGDAPTGVEHFVNESFMNDDYFLDPDHPESLVYDTSKGGRTLVAAMYMTKPGVPLEDVPDVGGALMQWHIHNNLCYQPTGVLGGLTDANGNCAPGLIKPPNTPMIHVWLTPQKCGPFSALEGIGGGQIADGQTRLCDHQHGDPSATSSSKTSRRSSGR